MPGQMVKSLYFFFVNEKQFSPNGRKSTFRFINAAATDVVTAVMLLLIGDCNQYVDPVVKEFIIIFSVLHRLL